MAQPEPVAPVEGYRRRDRDGVVFLAPDDASAPETSQSIRVIEAAHLIVVGEIDFGEVERLPDGPGEWGRIGPERRARRRVPPADDPFDRANNPGVEAKD